jgi:hypothetical protein
MQAKISMKYHCTSTMMAKIKKTSENKKQLEFLYVAGGTVKWHKHFENQFGSFLKKLQFDPVFHSWIYIQEK